MIPAVLYLLLAIILLLLVSMCYLYVLFSERVARLEGEVKKQETDDNNGAKYGLMLWLSEIGAARTMSSRDRARYHGVERDEFDKALYLKLLQFDDMRAFRSMIDNRLRGYSSRLCKDYPALSEKEERMIYFYLLNLDDATITLLSGYSPTSLPKIKNRLCKKMLIPNASMLRQFLHERL